MTQDRSDWCRPQESNLRPPDYKSGALPTELGRPGDSPTSAPTIPQPALPPTVRLRFKKFRSALAAQRAIETLPTTRTKLRNWIERNRSRMPEDIFTAATALLQAMNCEATTRKMAEHDFQVKRVQTDRDALIQLLRST